MSSTRLLSSCVFSELLRKRARSFRVVIELRARQTSFSFLTILACRAWVSISESAGLPFQFAFSLSLIDITLADRLAEQCGKVPNSGRQQFYALLIHLRVGTVGPYHQLGTGTN